MIMIPRLSRTLPGRAWWLLAAWTSLWTLPHIGRTAVSWRYFDLGGRLLASGGPRGGLHVYAAHPALQFGPLSLLAAAAFRVFGSEARFAAVIALVGVGLVLVEVIGNTRIGGERPTKRRLFAGALVFLPVWTELAVHYTHVDDALALLFALLAVRCVSEHRALAASVLLACAVDSKPWAAAFLPVLLALPPGARVRSVLTSAAAVAAGWLPFLIVDPGTLRLAAFSIPNTATSALRALGVASKVTPAWDRPTQLVLGCLVAAAAVATGRWPAAIFGAIAVRVLIDPGTYAYYTSGLVLAALLVDLYLTRNRIPVYAVSAAVLVYAARALPIDLGTLGTLRAVYCILAIASLFLLSPVRRQPRRHAIHAASATPRSATRYSKAS